MVPGNFDFTLIQGAHDGLVFQITEDGVLFDLTGYTVEMQIRTGYDKPVILQATTADRITVEPLIGKVSIVFTPEDTTPIAFKGESLECVYAVEITSPAGFRSRAIEGNVSISREVVR